jgi:Thiopeptide-type bacteriocin precursor
VFEFTFDADDLVMDDLDVTAMRDAVALPETGASAGSCSGASSCCCCVRPPQEPTGF